MTTRYLFVLTTWIGMWGALMTLQVNASERYVTYPAPIAWFVFCVFLMYALTRVFVDPSVGRGFWVGTVVFGIGSVILHLVLDIQGTTVGEVFEREIIGVGSVFEENELERQRVYELHRMYDVAVATIAVILGGFFGRKQEKRSAMSSRS